MPKSSEIEGLLSRLEAATGPDREIDIDLCLALNYVDSTDEPPLNLRRAQDDEGWLDYEVVEAGKLIACTDCAPRLTASIDAALALAEWMLPAANWGVDKTDEGDQEAWFDATVGEGFGQHRTAPIAILLALLHALFARPRP